MNIDENVTEHVILTPFLTNIVVFLKQIHCRDSTDRSFTEMDFVSVGMYNDLVGALFIVLF